MLPPARQAKLTRYVIAKGAKLDTGAELLEFSVDPRDLADAFPGATLVVPVPDDGFGGSGGLASFVVPAEYCTGDKLRVRHPACFRCACVRSRARRAEAAGDPHALCATPSPPPPPPPPPHTHTRGSSLRLSATAPALTPLLFPWPVLACSPEWEAVAAAAEAALAAGPQEVQENSAGKALGDIEAFDDMM